MQASITWKQCTNLPTNLNSGKTTSINGKVYCGGGDTDDDDDYIVYSYDPFQDNWSTLPPLPVKWFGVGQVNGKLVAVGGRKKSDGRPAKEVFTYDERSRRWKTSIPPMPNARYFPGVLSLQSALVVAGGKTSYTKHTDAVEIFKADSSQWYRTDRLPTACRDISLIDINNTCYALGGYDDPSNLNQALYTSVDDLLRNAVPVNQTTHSDSNAVTQSAWKTLHNTPSYDPVPAMLANNLLAIGGRATSEFGAAEKKDVYMFSPSTDSWLYISDLPQPRSYTTAAVLSSTEILVIGGWCSDTRVNTTYKGTLQLKV